MSLTDLEFKRGIFLGERVAAKHEFFKIIAKLGFAEAEDYAMLEVAKTIFPEKADFLEGLQGVIEITGMASFLRATTEITRLSFILGEIEKARAYGT